MKRLYWRPQKCTPAALALVALLATAGMAAVQQFRVRSADPLAEEKLAAARIAEDCFRAIRTQRVALGHAIDPQLDPTYSGMLGVPVSPVTSIPGHLPSKQASANPNFAAAVVQMLADAGVRSGDQIAVGYTGSLPALNVAVCAACEAMGVKPVIVASATSSQFGANLPDLMWVDMERILRQQGLVHCGATAVSIGGFQDRGSQFSDSELELIQAAIERSGVTFLDSNGYADSIEKRMAIYREAAQRQPIKAYVNVGGGTVSVGKAIGKRLYKPGLNLTPPRGASEVDCVMTRFANTGIPVIHLVEVRQLASRYQLPVQFNETPAVGQGNLFGEARPSRFLTAIVLCVILLALRGIVLTDWSHWLLQRLRSWRKCHDADSPDSENPHGRCPEPEWMV